MTTIINNPGGEEKSSSFVSIIVVVILIAVALGLFFVYGLPMLRNNSATPKGTVDINVTLPEPTSPKADTPAQ